MDYLYRSTNSIRVTKLRTMRWAGHVACVAEKSNVYRVLVGKPEGNRSLGRRRCRWEPNIKMDIEVGKGDKWYGLDLSGSGYSQVVNCCKYGNESFGPVKCGDFLTRRGHTSLSKRILPHGVG